jgi:gamma-glutamyltranspeptidase/glutathione hydrolase
MIEPTIRPSGDRPSGNPNATRSPAVGRRGMVATSQTLASAAGLAALQRGGNAIDAAVAAATVLAVVEPSMNGLGGDLFALVHDAKSGRVHALNAGGRAPAAATPAEFARRGLAEMPASGVLSVTVPGVVSGWAALLERFGTISLAEALAPAIQHALDGFPVA